MVRPSGSSFDSAAKEAHTEHMTFFKCPHCEARYELIVSHVSYRQRSYANCQVCWKTMYSWDSTRVPRFTLVEQPEPARAPV